MPHKHTASDAPITDDTANDLPREPVDADGGEAERDPSSLGFDDETWGQDASRVMSQVDAMVKSNPGIALLVAAACGFLLGRALSSGR